MEGHTYQNCPDRFSNPKGKGKFKGSVKGKFGKGKFGKGKSLNPKGKTYFVDLACVLSAQWDDAAVNGRAPTRAILDTGASENAIGIDCLHDLVVSGKFNYVVDRDELPTFRFGNGHKDQALSRASLSGTSLGTIHFYVLGGMAKGTPPLIGARTLRGKNAMLSYADGLFRYHEPNVPRQLAVQMQALTSGHLTIDLAEAAQAAAMPLQGFVEAPRSGSMEKDSGCCSDVFHEPFS